MRCWLVLGLLERTSAGPVASRHDTAAYVQGQVDPDPGRAARPTRVPRAAQADPLRDVPRRRPADRAARQGRADRLRRELRPGGAGGPGASRRASNQVLDAGTRQLERAGFESRSAYLTSPTFGALSWLAHATLQSGLWVDSQPRYDVLVTSPRLTLTRLFGEAGWRTVAAVPANNRDWPQGEFYDFDHVYDSRNVGYEGPRFGYPTMPDQYTLDAFHRLELAPRAAPAGDGGDRPDHQPRAVVAGPRLIAQAEVGDGSVFDGHAADSCPPRPTSGPTATRVRAAYFDADRRTRCGRSIRFLTTYGDDDLVVVMLGDHQPATIVSGPDAGHDVPVSLIARDPAVLDRISGWGWAPGLRPAPRRAGLADGRVPGPVRRGVRRGSTLVRPGDEPRGEPRGPRTRLREEVRRQSCPTPTSMLMQQLHDDHAVALWRYCRRLVPTDQGRAEDVAQETLLRAWRHRTDPREPAAGGAVRGCSPSPATS